LDVVLAQARLEEEREINGTLSQDQHYYFKIIVVKDENDVRITVRCWSSFTPRRWRIRNRFSGRGGKTLVS